MGVEAMAETNRRMIETIADEIAKLQDRICEVDALKNTVLQLIKAVDEQATRVLEMNLKVALDIEKIRRDALEALAKRKCP